MKNKILTVLGIVLITISIIGCTPTQKMVAVDSVNIISKMSVLKNQYQTVYTIIVSKDKSFTDDEKKELMNIDQNARVIYEKIDEIIHFRNFDVSPEEVKYLYTMAKENYMIAKDIIESHKDEFSKTEINKLNLFDAQLKELDRSVTKLLENPDTQDTRDILLTIIQVASISLKIIIPLLI